MDIQKSKVTRKSGIAYRGVIIRLFSADFKIGYERKRKVPYSFIQYGPKSKAFYLKTTWIHIEGFSFGYIPFPI